MFMDHHRNPRDDFASRFLVVGRRPTAPERAYMMHALARDLHRIVSQMHLAYDENGEDLNTEQGEAACESYAASLDEWALTCAAAVEEWEAKAKAWAPCRFTFEGDDPRRPEFPGFVTGATWNGFPIVAVDQEGRAALIAWSERVGDQDSAEQLRGAEPDEQGRYVLAGWTPEIIDPSEEA